MERILKFLKVLVIVGLVIHFTIKDMYYPSSILFYALPLPILTVIGLTVSVFSKKGWRIVMLVIVIGCSTLWASRSYKHNVIDAPIDGLEFVFWNARHNKQFQDAFNENNGIPDVLVLVEYDNEKVNDAKVQYPEYHFYITDSSGIGIFSKTPLRIVKEITHDDKSSFVNFETLGFNFYAVDISASYLNFRKESLKFVADHIGTTGNTIVLGDFNTPIESQHFSFFKENFQNAFDIKGNGFRETWFWNIPLLMLDHIWVSKDVKILATEKIKTFESDHCLIKTIIKR